MFFISVFVCRVKTWHLWTAFPSSVWFYGVYRGRRLFYFWMNKDDGVGGEPFLQSWEENKIPKVPGIPLSRLRTNFFLFPNSSSSNGRVCKGMAHLLSRKNVSNLPDTLVEPLPVIPSSLGGWPAVPHVSYSDNDYVLPRSTARTADVM